MHSDRFRVVGVGAVVVASCALVVPLLAGAPAVAGATGTPAARFAGSGSAGSPGSATAAGSVTPKVREVPVADVDRPGHPDLAAESAPQPVDGYGVVGATWRGASPAGLRLAVRTRSGGHWSPWTRLLVAAADHGPDPAGPEALAARVGTEPLAVGEVSAVQVRATSTSGESPKDLELSVVDPGRRPADRPTTARSGATADGLSESDRPVDPTSSHITAASGAVRLPTLDTSGVRAPRPRIRSRKAWGADNRLRSGSPRFGRVKAAFVHHTVNSNDYSRADVPAIIRGIYAYHTQSLGWSDIGYNFLVDKFGRIWVGRYGGRRRAVIGAHTYGYNHLSTGASAIGNFQTRRPPRRVIGAFGRLVGWKLGLHGVRAGDRRVWMEGSRFRAVNGHRDAGQTACPGINLYRRLDNIRQIAIRRQQM
jgi:N-acetylmuramoyl-L-alanine amidase